MAGSDLNLLKLFKCLLLQDATSGSLSFSGTKMGIGFKNEEPKTVF
jgi:hypothetical protein